MSQYKLFLRLAIVLISFFGILDAGYLTWNEMFHITPPCRPPFACQEVLSSSWSHIGPIPLSMLGIVYYALIFTLGVVFFLEGEVISLPLKVKLRTSELLRLLTTLGIVFSLYLVFVMAFILHAWCLYCVFSASFSLILYILVREIAKQAEKRTGGFVPSLKRGLFRALYQWIAKPIFFLFDAECVHVWMTRAGRILGLSPLSRLLTRMLFSYTNPVLGKNVCGIHFSNPIGLSAGFDYNGDLTRILPDVGFGFATIGTVTLEPYEGNAKPRLGRFPHSKALLVNKGFKSLGARAIIAKLQGKAFSIPIGISIGSTNKLHESLDAQVSDIGKTFSLFEKSSVHHSYYELNISCPNTQGGQPFTTSQRLNTLLLHLQAIKIKKPVFLKMPIDLDDTQTLSLLRTAAKYQVAGVIFGNLTKDKDNPDVNVHDRAQWRKIQGNLSGKPTWRRSNHYIRRTKQTFGSRFVIIGTGGVFSPQDAQTKINIGADLIQLITGMIYEGPQLIGEINEYLSEK